MILSISNCKGGVGKTMLANNIAIAQAMKGRKVLVIDRSPEGDSVHFANLRVGQFGDAGYDVVKVEGDLLSTRIAEFAGRYQDVVIDSGQQKSLAAYLPDLKVSDAVLIPLQPSWFDTLSAPIMVDIVKEARISNPDLKAGFLINSADVVGHENDRTASALSAYPEIPLLPVLIKRRVAYLYAAKASCSVLELKGKRRDLKAIAELQALIELLFEDDATPTSA